MKATRKMKCSAKAAALSVVMALAAWGLSAAEGVSRADGKGKVRVACIGDSITWGVCDDEPRCGVLSRAAPAAARAGL